MPFVWVRIDPHKISGPKLGKLVKKLPTIVAEALSVPGTEGELTSNDIEVKAESFGPFDIHTHDVETIIFAGYYPERQENLDERRKQITRGILANLISDVTGFVWVLPAEGSFGEW